MKRNTSERGGALLLCIIVTLVIVGISGAYLSFSSINARKTTNDMFGLQALYSAEAGAAMFIHEVNMKPIGRSAPAPRTLANDTPVQLQGGTYVIPAAGFIDYGSNGRDDDGDNTPDNEFERNFVRFQSVGTHGGVTRRLEIVLNRTAGGVFWNAVFAGNNSNNPNYNLEFNGAPGNGDLILGNIYSGGSFSALGSAALRTDTGGLVGSDVMYRNSLGTAPVGPDYVQGTQADLSIPRNALGQTGYEEKAALLRAGVNGVGRQDPLTGVSYFDVAYDLATRGSTLAGANNGGAQAGQSNGSTGGLGRAQAQISNRNEPSHIFRKNPTQPSSTQDRTVNYAFVNTAKDDYYIEDPTHTGMNNLNVGYSINGSSAADGVYLSPNGNNAVYFVDGNLWVSHDSLKSYQWVKPTGTTQMKVTIVVKGNVNFTDNLVYSSLKSQNDAVAILALNDGAYQNKMAADFTNSANTLKPGLTVAQFKAQFDTLAAQAGNDTYGNRKIPNLDLTTPAGLERAASEYNRAYGSGNVFYGDPGSGTVEYFESYMYAENNFYATNLDSTQASGGTQRVEIFGNMTAGNQVNIMRDTARAGYIPLRVSFDNRVATPGAVSPPALPSTPGFGSGDWSIASWKQLP